MEINRSPLFRGANFTLLFLTILAILAVIFQFTGTNDILKTSGSLALHFGTTVLFSLLLYFVFSKLTKTKHQLVTSFITGLILFLIIHPSSGYAAVLMTLLATTIAFSLKFFILSKRAPLLNPAAGGIFFTLIFVSLLAPNIFFFPSWWGVSFGKIMTFGDTEIRISFFLVLLYAIVGLPKWRKAPLAFFFLLTTFIGLFFAGVDRASLSYLFLDATIYFFAAIMLTDPKTSPVKMEGLIGYGILVGLFFVFLHPLFQFNFPEGLRFLLVDHSITALVFGNILFSVWRLFSRKA